MTVYSSEARLIEFFAEGAELLVFRTERGDQVTPDGVFALAAVEVAHAGQVGGGLGVAFAPTSGDEIVNGAQVDADGGVGLFGLGGLGDADVIGCDLGAAPAGADLLDGG